MPKPTEKNKLGRPPKYIQEFIQDAKIDDKPVEKPNDTKTNMTDNISVSFGFMTR